MYATAENPLPIMESILLPNAEHVIARQGVELPPFHCTMLLSRLALTRRRAMSAAHPEKTADELDQDAVDFLDRTLKHVAALVAAIRAEALGRA